MSLVSVFVDGSVNPRTKIGWGAFLAIEGRLSPEGALREQIKLKRMESTSSSRLELQALLWALGELGATKDRVEVYTDSQNIVGLPARRARLERNEFRRKDGEPLKNDRLYQEFFTMVDALDCLIMKVPGHRPASQKNDIGRIFALVDQASRQALRKESPKGRTS